MTSQSESDTGPVRLFLDNSTSPTLTTLVVVAATAALSMNFFLPSLPSMASFFAVDYALMQVAVSGYLGVTAVLQLIMGPLSDRYGRRPVLLASLGIFIVATVGCALSKSAEAFLFFRMMQALSLIHI